MTVLRTALLASLALGFSVFSWQALAVTPPQCPGHTDVRNQMTVSEFHNAGLGGSDKQQIKALNAWLTRYISGHCAANQSGEGRLQCPEHVDVRDQMTVTEFYQAGLNKLDKQQIKAFNTWLSNYVKGSCASHSGTPVKTNPKTAATPTAKSENNSPGNAVPHEKPALGAADNNRKNSTSTPSDSTGVSFGDSEKPSAQKPDRIESRIVGDFYGWTGSTVFHLANGQVWVQAGPGYFRIHLKNPKVTIKKLLVGYVMFLQEYSAKEVFVRRTH